MQIQKIISLIFNVKLVFFFLSNDSHTTLLFPHPNAFRLKMQFIRQDDNLFVFYVSFKKQFKLEINQTRDKNTLLSNMAPWHLGHHQRQRATCIFSTNLLPRKQVTKHREKFHDLFFWSRLYVFIWETVAYLQKRESKAQKCPQLTHSSSRLSRKTHRFLCLSGFSFPKVSMPHRVYLY